MMQSMQRSSKQTCHYADELLCFGFASPASEYIQKSKCSIYHTDAICGGEEIDSMHQLTQSVVESEHVDNTLYLHPLG